MAAGRRGAQSIHEIADYHGSVTPRWRKYLATSLGLLRELGTAYLVSPRRKAGVPALHSSMVESYSLKSESPERSSGPWIVLNDACHLYDTSAGTLVNADLKVRVTSEGEGVEP